ncbi:MAG: glycosyltransferase family 2 protein [Patescibacteria group bacterium]
MLQKSPASLRAHEKGSYAISLVTFNGEKYLPRCLQSVASQTKPPAEYRIWDNASTDSSRVSISKNTQKIDCVFSSENTGFARAHNDAIRSTRSEYILILNQDTVLEPSYCELLIAFMDKHPDVGSVSGLLIRIRSFDDIPRAASIDACGISLAQSQHAYLTHSGLAASHCTSEQEVFGVPATCALYRRLALEDCMLDRQGKNEYFDDDFFMYKEDVDLAYRMRLRQWKSYCIPQAICYHVRSAKSSFLVVNRGAHIIRYWSYRNHWYVLFKNVPAALLPFVGIQMIFYECAKCIYMILCEPTQLKAFGELWNMYAVMKKKRSIIQLRRTCSVVDLLKWMKRIFI